MRDLVPIGHRRNQRIRRVWFRKPPERLCRTRSLLSASIGMSARENAANTRSVEDLDGSLDAVRLCCESDVHEDQIGTFAFGKLDRLSGCRGQTDTLESRRAQVIFAIVRDEKLIFDDENADWLIHLNGTVHSIEKRIADQLFRCFFGKSAARRSKRSVSV
jgi:hypothetical protein